MLPKIISKPFKIIKKLGSGGCADIFEGINLLNNQKVAIKIEKKNSSLLKIESNIYSYLHNQECCPECIPHVYDYFRDDDQTNILIMDLLGPSLSDLFKKCGKTFSLKTVLMVAIINLKIMEFVHGSDVLHRDIKPNNFLIGRGKKNNRIYLIDYGYSKKFILENGKHIPMNNYSHITGTTRYASINNHLFLEQSRRDDLETLGYSWIYLLKGELPWQNLKAPKRQRFQRVKEKKMQITEEELCFGIPMEFATYIKYCKKLGFEEPPDYNDLKNLFQKLFDEKFFVFYYKFCWSS